MSGLLQWRTDPPTDPAIGSASQAQHWLAADPALTVTVLVPPGEAFLRRGLQHGLTPSAARAACRHDFAALLALRQQYGDRLQLHPAPEETASGPALQALVAALVWGADAEGRALAAQLFGADPAPAPDHGIDQLYAAALDGAAEPALQQSLLALQADLQRAEHEAELDRMAQSLLRDQLAAVQQLAESYVLALDEARGLGATAP